MPAPIETMVPLREPRLLQFRLRQMFQMVTLVTMLCALAAITRGPWPWVIALSAMLIAAHVLGNFVGTRLRDTSEAIVRWRNANPRLDPDLPYITSAEEAAAIRPDEPNLANFGRLVRGLHWFIIGGGIAGFVLAGTVLWLSIGHRISWIGMTVGAVSGSVMGTWTMFLAVSFTTIARDAWRQASDE